MTVEELRADVVKVLRDLAAKHKSKAERLRWEVHMLRAQRDWESDMWAELDNEADRIERAGEGA